MRLIDADKLTEQLEEKVHQHLNDEHADMWLWMYSYVMVLINDAETIER